MSEPKFSGPVPATPVAKAMETPVPQRTPIAPAPAPMTQEQREAAPGFTEAPPKPKRVRKAKPEKLSPKEIKALNARRAAALAAKRKPKVKRARAKRPGRPVGSKNKAKNPNRPLELKHRLDVVLSLSQQLRRPDMNVFVDLMKQLERLNRGTRVKVLAGLEQVFS